MIDVIIQPPQSNKASLNALANWANDDLLLTESMRRTTEEAWPRAFRVLDWATLREEFKTHDILASLAKKTFNRHGVTGSLLSVVGASLLAFGPLLPVNNLRSAVVVAGCSFVLGGGVMGLWHLIGHNGRSRWLMHRLWSERLRQFYFQYLVNNIDEAIAAMRDDTNLEKYRSLRDGALKVFINDIDKNLSARSFAEGIRWLAGDHDDAHAWGQSIWQVNRVLPGTLMTEDHLELMECMSQGRIGAQEVYAQLNLKKESLSQGNMARRVTMSGNIATFVFVVSLTLAGMWLLLVSRQESLPSDIFIALSGVAAAWGLYFRLLDQGMGYSLDSERFELYAEQVKLVRQRFNASGNDAHDKISALRQLEIYAYREMRQFLHTHFRSRFLG